jgi:hypothetical protein
MTGEIESKERKRERRDRKETKVVSRRTKKNMRKNPAL